MSDLLATADDHDERHFPWSYTEFGVLCACGAAMDSDENCLAPKPRNPEAMTPAHRESVYLAQTGRQERRYAKKLRSPERLLRAIFEEPKP